MTERKFTNWTAESIRLEDHEPYVQVESGDSIDLLQYWDLAEIQNSPQLVSLLGMGSDKYQLNDGVNDLSASQALKLVSSGIYNPAPTSPSGIPLIMHEPREGNETIIVTHDWCDPTTWSQQAVNVENEVLVDSGDGLCFNSSNSNWIDLQRGKVHNEELINVGFKPEIKADNVIMTMRTPFTNDGGDYEIDYKNGSVIFFESQAGKTVTASYHRSNGSLFKIAPSEGKLLRVEDVKMTFAVDLEMTDSIRFQPYAFDPVDFPNKVAVGPGEVFKTVQNFLDEATDISVMPATGGSLRGVSQDQIILRIPYKVVKPLNDSQGVEIRLWLENDIPLNGERATATFRCTSLHE